MNDPLQDLLAGIAGLLNDIPEYHNRFVTDSPEVVALALGLYQSLPDLLQAQLGQFGEVKLRFERGRIAFVNYERSRKLTIQKKDAGNNDPGASQ